jgi:hypothetical protein
MQLGEIFQLGRQVLLAGLSVLALWTMLPGRARAACGENTLCTGHPLLYLRHFTMNFGGFGATVVKAASYGSFRMIDACGGAGGKADNINLTSPATFWADGSADRRIQATFSLVAPTT